MRRHPEPRERHQRHPDGEYEGEPGRIELPRLEDFDRQGIEVQIATLCRLLGYQPSAPAPDDGPAEPAPASEAFRSSA